MHNKEGEDERRRGKTEDPLLVGGGSRLLVAADACEPGGSTLPVKAAPIQLTSTTSAV